MVYNTVTPMDRTRLSDRLCLNVERSSPFGAPGTIGLNGTEVCLSVVSHMAQIPLTNPDFGRLAK